MTGESACEPQMRQLVLRMTCIKPVTSTLSRAEIITRARKDARFPAGPAVLACGGAARPRVLRGRFGLMRMTHAHASWRTKQKARRVTTGLARLARGLGLLAACGGSAPSGPYSFAARSRRPGALEDSRACRTYGSHPSPEALADRAKQKARRVTTGLSVLAGGLGFEPR